MSPAVVSHNQCIRQAENIILVDLCSGRHFSPGCKRYDCPSCARKRKREVVRACEREFHGCRLRLATLTVRADKNRNPRDYDEVMRKAWRSFIRRFRQWETRKRRGWRKVRFLRVLERTLNDVVHYHVALDQYVPWKVVSCIWEVCLKREMTKNGMRLHPISVGALDVRTKKDTTISATRLGWYVAKYLSKSFHSELSFDKVDRKARRFSSSRTFKLRRHCPIVQQAAYQGYWVRMGRSEASYRSPLLVSLRIMPSVPQQDGGAEGEFTDAEHLLHGVLTENQGVFDYV